MFGKRGNDGFGKGGAGVGTIPTQPAAAAPQARSSTLLEPGSPEVSSRQQVTPPSMQTPSRKKPPRTEDYYDTKSQVFSALIDTIDLSQLAKLDGESAREEIRDIVNDIITIKNFAMSISEQEELLEDICNDVLGYGPLEPLLARDDIADIMVNGAGQTFIEVGGKTIESEIRFRDNSQLLSICQRIVSQVGRRVDESSPICDARLPDGSRVNVIAPPLAIDGPALTIRKFKKDKLNLEQLVKFGAITPEGAQVLQIIGRVRCNVVISGGTGSGKTTLLMMLAGFENPTSGAISVGGKRVDALPPHKRNMGVVFQNYALFPHMSVAENVAFPLKMRGISLSFTTGQYESHPPMSGLQWKCARPSCSTSSM